MVDRIAELTGRVQRTRAALEALAARAGDLRARVADALPVPPSPVTHAEPALAAALDRLAHEAAAAMTPMRAAHDGDDGVSLDADAWEIALINEEGK